MVMHKRRMIVVAIAVCLLCWVVTGCSKDSGKTTKPDGEVNLNLDKPNANSEILFQKTFGDTDKGSTIWYLEPDGSGGFYFGGRHNSAYSVGRLSAAGDPLWSAQTAYTPRDILTLAPIAAVPNGLVVVGTHDTDGDGTSDVGYVSLYSTSGGLLSQIVYTSGTSDVWVSSIATNSDSTFVVVGGERTVTGTSPLLATIALSPTGQLEKRSQTVISSMGNRYLGYVVTNPSELTGSELSFYVISREDLSSDYSPVAVHKISAPLPGLDPVTVDWTRDIGATGLGTALSDLCLFEDNLYLAGYALDAGKEPRPSDGGYWPSGVAGSVALTGELRWLKLIGLTLHSERFYGIAPAADAIYAVGNSAGFQITDSKETFGYGWLCKMAAGTGDVLSNMTFGQDSYESSFCDAVISGGAAHAGGWTRHEVSGGSYLAWFCAIDLTSPSPPGYAPAPPIARAASAAAHNSRGPVPDGGGR